MQDARRHQVQPQFAVVADNRVPGIVAPIEPDDVVGVRGEGIDDLAFALVAPMTTHNRCHRHVRLLATAGSVAALRTHSLPGGGPSRLWRPARAHAGPDPPPPASARPAPRHCARPTRPTTPPAPERR